MLPSEGLFGAIHKFSEVYLKDERTKKFVAGGGNSNAPQPSIADLVAWSDLTAIYEFLHIDVMRYPNVAGWYDRMERQVGND